VAARYNPLTSLVQPNRVVMHSGDTRFKPHKGHLLPTYFSWFPKSLHINARIVLRLGHNRFLPNPVQPVVNEVSYHLTPSRLDKE
jgi:hypothetical protein